MALRLIGRWTLVLSVLTAVAGAYVASPFVAAYTLREAIKSKDVATIERKVQWNTVRASLKTSLANHAQLLPEATAAGEAVKPTLWQRVKTSLGASMLDRFIESYVTPEGLSQLFAYRRVYKERIAGVPDEAKLPIMERAKVFFDRVKRAEFKSLTKVEIEVQDRNLSDRHYKSTFELQGFEWKLTELEVLSTISEGGPAAAPKLRLIDLAKLAARPASAGGINPFRRNGI
jgi:Protein of unknown function (DUF2939)